MERLDGTRLRVSKRRTYRVSTGPSQFGWMIRASSLNENSSGPEDTTMWKVAIVGAGYMATEHAKAFASLPNFQIAGICSRTRGRAEALATTYNANVFDSVDDLHDATRADVVVVTTPELATASVCYDAFKHPWLCFVEKPVGYNLAQAEQIQSAAKSSRARVYVALNRRAYSATRLALQELLGDDSLRLISILDQQDMVAALASGQPEAVVRNWMYANSIHMIDYFTVFGRGPVVSVNVTSPWTPNQPGFVVATIHFASGDIGTYQAVWNGPGPWSVTVTNSSVRAEMRPLEKLGVQKRGERRLTDVQVDVLDSEFKPGLRHQAEQIAKA